MGTTEKSSEPADDLTLEGNEEIIQVRGEDINLDDFNLEEFTPVVGISGFMIDDVSRIIGFVEEINKRHGMGAEALDCILAEILASERKDEDVQTGDTITKGIIRAICEWDL